MENHNSETPVFENPSRAETPYYEIPLEESSFPHNKTTKGDQVTTKQTTIFHQERNVTNPDSQPLSSSISPATIEKLKSASKTLNSCAKTLKWNWGLVNIIYGIIGSIFTFVLCCLVSIGDEFSPINLIFGALGVLFFLLSFGLLERFRIVTVNILNWFAALGQYFSEKG